MHSAAWTELMQLIPPQQHDNLLITMTNGRELAIQGIVTLVEHYMVVRGRVMGTSDIGGGYFFIPWSQIVYLGYLRPVSDAEVLPMYGLTPALKKTPEEQEALVKARAAAQAAAAERAAALAVPELDPTKSVQPTAPAAAPAAAAAPAKVSTAALLERLRQRRQGGGDGGKPSTSG